MYEVLPHEMRLANRPKDEVERAMLSRLDYTTVDLPNMMLSAAYLARFKEYDRALQLYRQASTLQPSRPEPYVMGLRLAKLKNNVAAIRWSTVGILTHVWTKDHQELHRRAENAALNLEESLRREGKKAEAESFSAEIAAAKSRDLAFELKWQGNADLDLIIEEPTDTLCSLQYPLSSAGGVLVHDGMGPAQEDTYEKIVYPRGMSGTYRVRIRHVWGEVVAKRAVLTVIHHQGTKRETVKRQTVVVAPEDTVVSVTLEDGRRKVVVPTSQLQPDVAGKISSNRPVLIPQSANNRQLRREFLEQRSRTSAVRRAGVGYQPVITVVPDGATLNTSAVVSADRRYVRMSIAPVFSTLTDVFTFSFLNTGGATGQNGVNPGQQ